MSVRVINLLRLLIGLMPASTAKNVLLDRIGSGWAVANTARLQPSLLWRIETLSVGAGAAIGTGNVFRDLKRVTIGRGASVGQFNWVTAAARIYLDDVNFEYRSLELGDYASLTSRQCLDCSGGVVVGEQSTIAGVRSTVMTHGPDIRRGRMEVAPVKIGRSCFISTNVVIIKGCTIADRIVVGAGSVVTSDLVESSSLYAGVPARRVGSMDDASYFMREGLLRN